MFYLCPCQVYCAACADFVLFRMASSPRDNRVPIMFSAEELKSIDDWRFSKRIGTRAGAVRRLLRIGVAFSDVATQLDDLTSELSAFDATDYGSTMGETPAGPPGSKEHLAKQWSLVTKVMEVLDFAHEMSKEGDVEKVAREADEAREFWRKGKDDPK